MPHTFIQLSATERGALEDVVASTASTRGHVRRARVVLLSADQVPNVEIARRLQLSVGQVSRIRARYLRGGALGLRDRPKPGRTDHAVPPEVVARIIALATSPALARSGRRRTRLVGAEVGRSRQCVADILRRHRLRESSATEPRP
jgi:transposase